MIRQFRSGDAWACCELVRCCIRSDLSLTSDVRNSLLEAETEELMRRRSSLFYIAVTESQNEITGLGGVDLNEIRLLFVSPVHWRKGIGSDILNHLETMVPPGFFRDIFVYAALGAVDFYKARGYRSAGSYEFTEGEIVIPTVFMTKPTDHG